MPIPDTNYPAVIDDYSALIASEVQPALNNASAHVRKALGGVSAIEFTLGVNPQGAFADVVTRLNAMQQDDADILTLLGPGVEGSYPDVVTRLNANDGTVQALVTMQGNYVLRAGDTMTGALFLGVANSPQTSAPSIILGDSNTGPDNSARVLFVGQGNAMGNGLSNMAVVGNGNTIGDGSNQNLVAGGSNNLGSGASGVLVSGFGHTIDGASQATMSGTGHYAGPSGQPFIAGAGNQAYFSGQAAVFGAGNFSRAASQSFIAGGSGHNLYGAQAIILAGAGANAVGDASITASSGSVAGANNAMALGYGSSASAAFSFAGGENSETGFRPLAFSVSGGVLVFSGDATDRFAIGSLIYMYGLTGGSPNPARVQATVTGVSIVGPNTEVQVNSLPGDHTAGLAVCYQHPSNHGSHSIAYGQDCRARAPFSAVFGQSNNVNPGATHSLLAGSGHNANAAYAYAFGQNITIGGARAAGFGSDHLVSGARAFAVGENNQATGYASFVSGFGNIVNGAYAAAFGITNTPSQTAAFASGESNNVDAPYSAAFGRNNAMIGGVFGGGSSNMAIGFQNLTNGGTASVVIGHTNAVYGNAFSEGNVAIGRSNIINGDNSVGNVALGGGGNTINGPYTDYNIVGGYNNSVANGTAPTPTMRNVVLGSNNQVLGSVQRTFSAGVGNIAGASESRAIGTNLDTNEAGQLLLGDASNYRTAGDALADLGDNRLKMRFLNGIKLVKGSFSTDYEDGPEYTIIQGSNTTSGASTAQINTIPVPQDSVILVESRIVARRTGGVAGVPGDSLVAVVRVRVKDIGGVISLHDQTSDYISQDQAWTVGFNSGGGSVVTEVTGAADNDITWHVTTKYQRLF